MERMQRETPSPAPGPAGGGGGGCISHQLPTVSQAPGGCEGLASPQQTPRCSCILNKADLQSALLGTTRWPHEIDVGVSVGNDHRMGQQCESRGSLCCLSDKREGTCEKWSESGCAVSMTERCRAALPQRAVCPQRLSWGGYIHRIFQIQPTQRAGVPKAWCT